jgi:hypothetical protein
MKYRYYDHKKDKKAMNQIFKEVGWIEGNNYDGVDILVKDSDSILAEINNNPECIVSSNIGEMKYLNEKLSASFITNVTTSFVARKRKLAKELTAQKIVIDVEKGAAVSLLGMFDQGFYEMLGFGSGNYKTTVKFSPSTLKIKKHFNVPTRLTKKDWKKVYSSRIKRLCGHGACNLNSVITKSETAWFNTGFGLGYFDNKILTHHIWLTGMGKEHGPYRIMWMSYQNYDQFLELMALIKSLGDQIKLIVMLEPPNIQLMDFLEKPFFYRYITRASKFANEITTGAYWQIRICNLKKCISKTHLKGDPVTFNLELYDPIEKFLPKNNNWNGLTGKYIITFGKRSKVKNGYDKNLQTLKTSVNAFTRFWMGILPANSLSMNDDFVASEELIKKLDELFTLPKPDVNWEF